MDKRVDSVTPFVTALRAEPGSDSSNTPVLRVLQALAAASPAPMTAQELQTRSGVPTIEFGEIVSELRDLGIVDVAGDGEERVSLAKGNGSPAKTA